MDPGENGDIVADNSVISEGSSEMSSIHKRAKNSIFNGIFFKFFHFLENETFQAI